MGRPKRVVLPRPHLIELREGLGLTSEKAAELSGLSKSTISRTENGLSELTESTAQALAAAYGVDIATIRYGEPVNNASDVAFSSVIIKGSVQAGDWSESPEWPQDEWYSMSIPHEPLLEGITLHGCVVLGDSMDRRYPEGTILIWSDIHETGEPLIDGKPYIVKRSRSGEFETTCKIIKLVEETWFLFPDSNNPKWKPVPATGLEGEELVVLGRVIRSYRNED